MAKPKAKAKAARKPREIKDAGQRVVLAGFEIDAPKVASQLAHEAGIALGNLDAKAREKALKPFLDRLGAGPDDKVKVWAKIGQVVAEDREVAVAAVVGDKLPGDYRAPIASAWRGRVNREIPDEVPLNVTVVDD